MSMPRLRSIGFMPAATALAPSRTIEWASTVAVVVPSPAISLVLEAPSRTIWAPMFSNLSSSSISLATVTPSLVMRGAPNDLSSTTLRPLGPSVTRTALARMSTPRNILSRASIENLTSLAAIFVLRYVLMRQPLGSLLAGDGLFDHAHDVALFHDQIFDPLDLDLRARPFAEQHAIANLEVDGDDFPGLVAAAWTNGDHLSLRRLLFGGIRNDDSPCGLIVGVDARNDDAVVKWPKLHINP